MTDNPACALAHPFEDRPPIQTPRAPGVSRRRVVLDPHGGRWTLLGLLLLRAARPGISVEFARRPTDAEAIVAALRDGAHAYVVGCGDPEADRAFVEAECDAPPYAAVD
jgi:hypothetical protein